jgi:phosphate transport system protein
LRRKSGKWRRDPNFRNFGKEDAMDRLFDEELRELRKKLLHMAAQVEESIALSVRSLKERKEELAREVFREEEITNQLDLSIDEIGMRLLALRQPMAADLRFITSAMKMASDLERIADHATNIAEDVIYIISGKIIKHHCDQEPRSEGTEPGKVGPRI